MVGRPSSRSARAGSTVRPLSGRVRIGTPEGTEDDAREGGRRVLRPLWIRPVSRRAAVSPSQRGEEAVLAQQRRCRPVARGATGRGSEMRAPLRELPRGGGSWSRRRPISPYYEDGRLRRWLSRSGVAQWQSIRLLTEGLWVRI